MIEYQEPFIKLLQRRSRLLRGLINGEKAYTGPFWADLDITPRCNLRCRSCLYHSPLVTKPKEFNPEVRDISVDFARLVARDLAALNTHTIIIQGAGEPLLHPGLFDIIAVMKEAGLHCRLLTNGTLIDDSMAEGFIEAGLDSLRVSIWANAPEELQGNSLKEDTKTFNKIRRGLGVLNKAKVKKRVSFPKVELYQAVNRNNYQSVAGLVELAQEHNCSGVHFAPLLTRRGQLDEYSLSPEQEKVCLQNLDKVRPWMEKRGISHNIDLLNLRFSQGKRVWQQAACFTPWFRMQILVDGTVKICRGCDKAFGRFDKQSLGEIWNGSALRAFRRKVSTREGLVDVAKKSDCYACCFFGDNWRIERIYRWLRPFVEWSKRSSAV